jgi:hypothetical protein
MYDFSVAKKVEQFSEVYGKTDMEAALAACIFHRKEMPIGEIGVGVHLNILLNQAVEIPAEVLSSAPPAFCPAQGGFLSKFPMTLSEAANIPGIRASSDDHQVLSVFLFG